MPLADLPKGRMSPTESLKMHNSACPPSSCTLVSGTAFLFRVVEGMLGTPGGHEEAGVGGCSRTPGVLPGSPPHYSENYHPPTPRVCARLVCALRAPSRHVSTNDGPQRQRAKRKWMPPRGEAKGERRSWERKYLQWGTRA